MPASGQFSLCYGTGTNTNEAPSWFGLGVQCLAECSEKEGFAILLTRSAAFLWLELVWLFLLSPKQSLNSVVV